MSADLTGELDLRVDASETPILNDENRFKLALFCVNTARGTTMSLDTTGLVKVSWDESVRICQRADRAGIDAVIPLARWRNVPRIRAEFDRVYETFTWAAAIAALTDRIQVFATFHTPLYPPLRAAKMATTLDHVSGGRCGINIVAGFSAVDFRMFGIELEANADPYDRTEEWLNLIKRAWTEDEPFDFDGHYYAGVEIISEPKPLQRPWPVIMCAGNSPRGKAFSAKHADVNFGAFPSFKAIPEIVAQSREVAGDAKVFGHGYVFCGDTEAEARRRVDHWVRDHVDDATAGAFVEQVLGFSGRNEKFNDRLAYEQLVSRAAAGFFALPLVGTPDQVAEGIQKMADGGLDGMAVSFPDYHEGIHAYDEAIRPLLVERGLRRR